VWLPDCFQANDSRRVLPPAAGRSESGLPASGLVLCCFNASAKITPPLFDRWCRWLAAAPDAVLWLLGEHERVRANLRHEAQRRGIGPDRLVFAPRVPYARHLARLQQADLFLDTFPFNAGATASDALWAGVPILTCSGEAFASRMAGSLLRAAGVPELITHSIEEYERLGDHLVGQPGRLQDLKGRLTAQRCGAALFDSARFTRHLEAAFTRMHQRSVRGEAPAGFALEPGESPD
jgi:predicted O-linked N-acetylglucosamine transferase (SPINDLY family)